MTDPYQDPAYLAAVNTQAEIEFLRDSFGVDGPSTENELQRAALLRVVDHEQDRADRLQGKLDEIESYAEDRMEGQLDSDGWTISNKMLHIVRRSENG